MAETPVNPFQIDGVDVAGMGEDTRHQLMPGPQSTRRVEHFPGSRTRFAIKGQSFYGALVVTGPLRAADPDALYALIEQHQDAVDSVALVSVTFHNTTFNNCDLVEFRQLDQRLLGYRDAEGAGVKTMVRFVFERLAA